MYKWLSPFLFRRVLQHINLLYHLLIFFTAAAITQESQKQSASTSSSSAVASNPFLLASKMKLPTSKTHRITMRIASYLLSDMRPFTTTESKEFRKLIHECEPKYQMPSRATFSEHVIPSMYTITANRLKAELKDAGGTVAITCDAWTSRATESYVTITAHYVDNDFNLCPAVLQTRAMHDRHTGVNTAEVLTCAEAEWGVRVASLTTDNASNMKVAARTANMIHVGCYAHTLNLAAGKATDVNAVGTLLGKIKSVVAYFHRSTIATAILKKKQDLLKLPSHKLVIDCKTRWNSSFQMVQRFLEQQVAVMAALADENIKRQKDLDTLDRLSCDELRKAENFVELMTPLYHATLAMSEEGKPTGSLILPLQKKLNKAYEKKVGDSKFESGIKEAITKSLGSRYQEETQLHFLQQVTAVDPRVKHHTDEDTWNRIVEKIADEHVNKNYMTNK